MTVCSGARWRRRARSLHSAAILTSALVTGRSSARRQGFACLPSCFCCMDSTRRSSYRDVIPMCFS
jgi:hypothetical protein